MKSTQLKMRATHFGLLPSLLVLFPFLEAPSQTEAVMNRLSGRWQGEGKTLGMPARFTDEMGMGAGKQVFPVEPEKRNARRKWKDAGL